MDIYQPSYPPVGTCAPGDTAYDHAYTCHIVAGKTASMAYSGSVPGVLSGAGGAGDICSPGTWTVSEVGSATSSGLTVSPTVTGKADGCGTVRVDKVTFLASSSGTITQFTGAEYNVDETYTVCHADGSCDPPWTYGMYGGTVLVVVDPPPTASPTPYVLIPSLRIAGANSSVSEKLYDPLSRSGNLNVFLYQKPVSSPLPAGTPEPPQSVFMGTRVSGVYTDKFNCFSLPFGTYGTAEADWTLSRKVVGTLKHTFTVPSQALFSKLSAAARGGQLSSGALAALPYLFVAFGADAVTDSNIMAAIMGELDHEDNWGTLDGGAEAIQPDAAKRAYDGQLGNGTYPSMDGYTYRGRGWIQLTGKANYQNIDAKYGTNSVANPDSILGNQPLLARIAVDGMLNGTFTGVKLSQYVNSSTQDFYNARRVVNGIALSDIRTILSARASAGYSLNYQAIVKNNC